jgi:hypothetical protein
MTSGRSTSGAVPQSRPRSAGAADRLERIGPQAVTTQAVTTQAATTQAVATQAVARSRRFMTAW